MEGPAGDGLLVRSTGAGGARTAVILPQDVLTGDFTSRLRGRLLPDFVDSLGNDLGVVISWGLTYYFCSVTSDRDPFIWRFDDRDAGRREAGAKVLFDPTKVDFELEAQATDAGIELRVWPEGDDRPAKAQVRMPERKHSPARVGIAAEAARVYSFTATSP